ncbi:MAG: DUF2065 domain-containing protein [Xanthomonadaceae bacterium]|nr:DUF2065 domain-containing protein [Xanthomonadaceae bacterium]
MPDLLAALCLVAVLEGLVLFVMPNAWKQIMAQLLNMEDSRLRRIGGILALTGSIALVWIRH